MIGIVQQIIFGLGVGAIYALVGIGFSLIYRSMGLLSFVQPQYVMLGSAFGYTGLIRLGLPLWAAIVPVGLATGVVSVCIDQIGLRPIRFRRGEEISLILATVGWGIVLVQAVILTYGPNALSLGGGGWPQLHAFGIDIRTDTLAILLIAAVLVAGLTLFLQRTRLGRAVRAVGEDAPTAALMGIDVERTYAVSAGISGALGGVAGLLVGYLFVAGVSAGQMGVKSLAGAVLGGFGHLPGALIGGLVVGVFDNLVATEISSTWRDAIVFALVIVVLLIRPRGLFGKRRYVHS